VSIIRRGETLTGNYYILDKHISEDARLSWEARGLLVFLLGKPNAWAVSIQHLINCSPSAGRDRISRMINELKKFGYLTHQRGRKSDGTLGDSEYVVREIPEMPDPGHPKPDYPVLVDASDGVDTEEMEQPKPDYPVLVDPPKPDYPEQVLPEQAKPLLVSNEYKQVLKTTKQQQQQKNAHEPLTDRDRVTLTIDWEPPAEVLDRLENLRGIPLDFSRAQVGPFVSHWLAAGDLGNFRTWVGGFHAWVVRDWQRRADTASYRVEDHDWRPWLELDSDLDGIVSDELIQSWLTIRRNAKVPVTSSAILWVADEIREASRLLAYPAIDLLREAIGSGWVTIRGIYLVERFQKAGLAPSCKAQVRL
jgi:hypothetical protein